jgi:hypothetical protein
VWIGCITLESGKWILLLVHYQSFIRDDMVVVILFAGKMALQMTYFSKYCKMGSGLAFLR